VNVRGGGSRTAAPALAVTVALLALAPSGAAGCGDDLGVRDQPISPGGDTTVRDRTSGAYSLPAPNLDDVSLALHLEGDADFEAAFVTAPAPVNAGLGPLYNHTSCVGCHLRDGRGLPLLGVGSTSQALVRVSLASGVPTVPGGPVPVPGLGTQLQDHAIFGVVPEVEVELRWDEEPGRYDDGEPYSLRRPRLQIVRGDDRSPLPADVLTSLRIAPPMFGRGLLAAVAEDTLRALADPDDVDGDGIKGQLNQPWDGPAGRPGAGRFGHKANTATLEEQVAAAYANDMGVSNPTFRDGAAAPDIDADTLAAVTMYSATLAVPARAPATLASRRGEDHFAALGCAGCHIPTLVTGEHEVAALANQEIWPYSDLLLHDLGDELADHRPDFAASGAHWRTAPLWGLGLVQTVTPGAGYLHDGRARTVAEAILWHGGEAAASRDAFRAASRRVRDDLLAFLSIL
jgi:CxxC motif-containing protein (DUF1111 family)